MNLNLNKSVTLIELIIAVSLFGVLVVAFTSFDTYSRHHVIVSDRRARLQNELAYALEQMSKYVLQGTGNFNNQPLQQTTNGFRVRVDYWPYSSPVQTPTPQNLNDDLWFNFSLNANTLSSICTQVTPGVSPACPFAETLSTRIIAGVVYGPIPSNPTSGFYINFTDSNTMVEVGLVGRWNLSSAVSVDNPQVVMKSKVYSHSSGAR